MYLQISYQNGGSRFTRLHPSFFTLREPSIEERVKSLAMDSGKFPHKIFLQKDDEVLIDRVYNENKPLETQKQVLTPKAKRTAARNKKLMKKEVANTTFTHKIVFGANGVQTFVLGEA